MDVMPISTAKFKPNTIASVSARRTDLHLSLPDAAAVVKAESLSWIIAPQPHLLPSPATVASAFNLNFLATGGLYLWKTCCILLSALFLTSALGFRTF